MLYLGEQLAKKGHKPTFLLGARSDKDLLQLEDVYKRQLFTSNRVPIRWMSPKE